ncbi:MAG: methionine--tRNA ligase [Acidobacteria bacterium]|nr:methionine--tRNA ligase [Acidobacteriota bacterium]
MKKFYLTTPIYYVNSRPHLGHLYTTLVADTLARYKRQRRFDVFFLTGTDEHGVNIERAAEARGIPVKQHVDEMVAEFQEMFPKFDLHYDDWIRTTAPDHYESAQQLWRRIRDAGYIYKGEYAGWYCPNCNEFKAEGSLQQPICPIHEYPTELVQEESYFFRLSEFEKPLLDYYREHPEFVQPEVRRNEVISFVKSGLRNLSISRSSITWGIPVPDDPPHVMYVWFDALSNYITALGYPNGERFKKYWPADLQLVGKDILRFHTVYWPAFLMAAGIELPKTVYAHGFWLIDGRKMSKSLGNVIELPTLKRFFSNDMVRYFCLREMVFGHDCYFSYDAAIDRVNADLANGLGNLASRVLAMVRKYCDGAIPVPNEEEFQIGEQDWVQITRDTVDEFIRYFDKYQFSRALEVAWRYIAIEDNYISSRKPWDLAKHGAFRGVLDNVIGTAVRSLRVLAVLLAPVLPDATVTLWHELGLPGKPNDIDPIAMFEEIREGQFWLHDIPSGTRIGQIQPLFPRIDKEKTMAEIEGKEHPAPTPAAAKADAEPSPERPYITIEDFAKIDMRVGTVLTAQKVEKTDKLLLLTVDIGEEQPRQLLAGIANEYKPEDIIGRKVIVVANLQPRKVRGYESNGMILAAAVGDEGRPVLAGFLEDVPNGARLK